MAELYDYPMPEQSLAACPGREDKLCTMPAPGTFRKDGLEMKDLKEFTETLRENLQAVKDSAKVADEMQAKCPEAAAKELNDIYCELMTMPQHDDNQLKGLAELADTVNPIIDSYLDEYERASIELNKIRPAMTRLALFRDYLAKARARLDEKKRTRWEYQKPKEMS